MSKSVGEIKNSISGFTLVSSGGRGARNFAKNASLVEEHLRKAYAEETTAQVKLKTTLADLKKRHETEKNTRQQIETDSTQIQAEIEKLKNILQDKSATDLDELRKIYEERESLRQQRKKYKKKIKTLQKDTQTMSTDRTQTETQRQVEIQKLTDQKSKLEEEVTQLVKKCTKLQINKLSQDGEKTSSIEDSVNSYGQRSLDSFKWNELLLPLLPRLSFMKENQTPIYATEKPNSLLTVLKPLLSSLPSAPSSSFDTNSAQYENAEDKSTALPQLIKGLDGSLVSQILKFCLSSAVEPISAILYKQMEAIIPCEKNEISSQIIILRLDDSNPNQNLNSSLNNPSNNNVAPNPGSVPLSGNSSMNSTSTGGGGGGGGGKDVDGIVKVVHKRKEKGNQETIESYGKFTFEWTVEFIFDRKEFRKVTVNFMKLNFIDALGGAKEKALQTILVKIFDSLQPHNQHNNIHLTQRHKGSQIFSSISSPPVGSPGTSSITSHPSLSNNTFAAPGITTTPSSSIHE